MNKHKTTNGVEAMKTLDTVNIELDRLKAAIEGSVSGVRVRHCQGRLTITAKESGKGGRPAVIAAIAVADAHIEEDVIGGTLRIQRRRTRAGSAIWWTLDGTGRPDQLRAGYQAKLTDEEEAAVIRSEK